MRRWYSKITRYIIPHSFSKLPLTPNHLKTIFLNLAVGASGWVLVGIPEYSHLFPPTYLLPPTSKNYFLNSSHPHPMAKNPFSWGYILRKVKIDDLEKMFGKTFCLMYTGNESLYIPAINATNAALVVRNPLQCAATWGRSQKWRRKLLKGGLDASCSGEDFTVEN